MTNQLVRPRRRDERRVVHLDVDGDGPAMPVDLEMTIWDVGLVPMLVAAVLPGPAGQRVEGTVVATLDRRHVAFAQAAGPRPHDWRVEVPSLMLLDGEVIAGTKKGQSMRWQGPRFGVTIVPTWRGGAVRNDAGLDVVRAGMGRTRLAATTDPAELTLVMALLAHGTLGRRGVATSTRGHRRVAGRAGHRAADVAGDVAGEAVFEVVLDGVGEALGAVLGGIFDGL